MRLSKLSLSNSQPSVGVLPNVNFIKDAQTCTVIKNSAWVAQQPTPEKPFGLILLCNLSILLVHSILL